MPEVEPLTAEEIIVLRGILQKRKYIMTGFFIALGAALLAAMDII